MNETTEAGLLWRVGYHAALLEFTPLDMYAFNHRFDDIAELHRFRTMYFADFQETCLREVLTDFRPNLAARHGISSATAPRPPTIFPLSR